MKSGIQDTLPAVIEQHCSTLQFPSSVVVDASQTQLKWSNFVRPEHLIRNHPGSQYAYIGATGLAASNGNPTMTARQAADIERRMHGVIGLTSRGRKIVGVLTPHRRETWLIDDHDDVVDVGIVHPVPNRDIAIIRWQGSTPDYSLRTRYPMPIRPTPRRHPAFRMMTEIAASARPVTLHHAAADTAAFLFTDEGDVRSTPFSGIWWISEGDIKIDILGKVEAYPWRDFAKAADWSPPHEPAPPPLEEHYGD